MAVRGPTDTLRFAVDQARLQGATLVCPVCSVCPVCPGDCIARERWGISGRRPGSPGDLRSHREDRKRIRGQNPLYTVSESADWVILDQAATLGVDHLILGATARNRMVRLLRGDMVVRIAEDLPEEIKLLIYG